MFCGIRSRMYAHLGRGGDYWMPPSQRTVPVSRSRRYGKETPRNAEFLRIWALLNTACKWVARQDPLQGPLGHAQSLCLLAEKKRKEKKRVPPHRKCGKKKKKKHQQGNSQLTCLKRKGHDTASSANFCTDSRHARAATKSGRTVCTFSPHTHT